MVDREKDSNITDEQLWKILETIPDPELPYINIVELKIVRGVSQSIKSGLIEVSITPTYSGCPAMDFIEKEIIKIFSEKGLNNIQVKKVYSPPWSTKDLSEETMRKMEDNLIAPPRENTPTKCPKCQSGNVQKLGNFGSTSCKAMLKCLDCLEPFEKFKCH